MSKRRSFYSPTFAPVPSTGEPALQRWLDNYTRQNKEFVRDVIAIGADYDLIANVTTQTIYPGFTLTPDSYNIELVAGSDSVSDASTPIKAGRDGQTIVLTNIWTPLITLKNTGLWPSDIVLKRWDTVILRWSVYGGVPGGWLLVSGGPSSGITGRAAGFIDMTVVDNVGSTINTPYAWTVPANALRPGSDGSYLRVRTWPYFAPNINLKRIGMYFPAGTYGWWWNSTSITLNLDHAIMEYDFIPTSNTTIVGYGKILRGSSDSGRTPVIEDFRAFALGGTYDFTGPTDITMALQGSIDGDIRLHGIAFEIHRI